MKTNPSLSELEKETPGVDRFAHFVVRRKSNGELDKLGSGAMGVTYRAADTQLDREVALNYYIET